MHSEARKESFVISLNYFIKEKTRRSKKNRNKWQIVITLLSNMCQRIKESSLTS